MFLREEIVERGSGEDQGVLNSWELGVERNKRGYFRKGPPMVLLDGCDDSKGKEGTDS